MPEHLQVFWAKGFGLLQRAGKLRVIDDCSIGGVNGALGVVERYQMHAIDGTAAFLTGMLQFSQKGIVLEGMSGRTYDMKQAYKQYGIAEADSKLVRLAVSRRFLRISLAVWYVGLVMFRFGMNSVL